MTGSGIVKCTRTWTYELRQSHLRGVPLARGVDALAGAGILEESRPRLPHEGPLLEGIGCIARHEERHGGRAAGLVRPRPLLRRPRGVALASDEDVVVLELRERVVLGLLDCDAAALDAQRVLSKRGALRQPPGTRTGDTKSRPHLVDSDGVRVAQDGERHIVHRGDVISEDKRGLQEGMRGLTLSTLAASPEPDAPS